MPPPLNSTRNSSTHPRSAVDIPSLFAMCPASINFALCGRLASASPATKSFAKVSGQTSSPDGFGNSLAAVVASHENPSTALQKPIRNSCHRCGVGASIVAHQDLAPPKFSLHCPLDLTSGGPTCPRDQSVLRKFLAERAGIQKMKPIVRLGTLPRQFAMGLACPVHHRTVIKTSTVLSEYFILQQNQ